MKRNIPLLLSIWMSFTCWVSQAQMSVNQDFRPYNWVQNLVGTGVQFSNVKFNGVNYNQNSGGTFRHIGTFADPTGNFRFNDGPMMATLPLNSIISNGVGSDPRPGEVNRYQDVDLITIASRNSAGSLNLVDAAVIEFDFVPTGNKIEFDYLFASMEYETYVCTKFNDVFGFFLSGPGVTGSYSGGAKNIAIAPKNNPGDPDVEVAINSVNGTHLGTWGSPNISYCNLPGGGNALNNSNYYVENNIFWMDANEVKIALGLGAGANVTKPVPAYHYDINIGGSWDRRTPYVEYDFMFNGFTDSLTATETVYCGQTYHIKLAIADVSDGVFDSGVFFRKNSFVSIPPPGDVVGESFDKTAIVTEHCGGGRFIFSRLTATTNIIYNITVGGTATNGSDYGALQSDGSVIPVGATFTLPIGVFADTLTIVAISDTDIAEGDETVSIGFDYIDQCGDPQSIGDILTIENAAPVVISFDPPDIDPCSSETTSTLTFSGDVVGGYDIKINYGDGDTESLQRFNDEPFNFTHTYDHGAVYPLELIYTDYVCGITDTLKQDISVIKPPTLDLDVPALDDIDLCDNKRLEIEGVIPVAPVLDSFYWSIEGLTDIFKNDTTPEIDIPASGTYQAYLIAVTSNPSYCKQIDSSAFTITVKPFVPVDFDFAIPPLLPCAEGTETTVDFSANVDGVYDVTIDYGNNRDTWGTTRLRNEALNESYTYPNGATYNAKVTYKDSICEKEVEVDLEIIIPEAKKLDLQVPPIDDIDLCSNKSLIINGVIPTSPVLDSFYWDIPTITSNFRDNANPEFDIPASGTYTAHLIAVTSDTSYCKKQDTASFQITVKDAVPVDFDLSIPPTLPCTEGTETTVDFTADIIGIYDVTIDYGHNSDTWGITRLRDETLDESYDYPNGATYNARVIYKDSVCEKQDTVDLEIIIPEAKKLDLLVPPIDDIDQCSNQQLSISGVLPVTPALDSFYWTIPTVTNNYRDIANPVIDILPSGTHISYLIAVTSDPSYCKKQDTAVFQITVKDAVSVDFDLTIPVAVPCSEGTETTVDFAADIVGVYDVTVDYGHNNDTWGSTRLRDEALNESYSYPNGAIYNAQVVYKDSICEKQDTVDLIIDIPLTQILNIDIPPISSIEGCGVPFVQTLSANIDESVITDFYWTNGNGVKVHEGETSPEFSFTHTGDTTIYFVGKTSNPAYCKNEDSVAIKITTIEFPVFEPIIDVPEIDPCAENNSLKIDIKFIGTVKPDTVVWNFGDGTELTTIDIDSMSHSYLTEGKYFVDILLHDPSGCRDKQFLDTIEFKIPTPLTLDARVDDYIRGCSPYVANFHADTSGNVTDFYWLFENATKYHALDTTFNYTSPGTYVAKFIATTDDPRYCILADTSIVEVIVDERFRLNPEVNIEEPEPCTPSSIQRFNVNIDPKLNREVPQLWWNFGDGSDSINSITPFEYEYTVPGTYDLTYTVFDTLCQDTITGSEEIIFERGAILKDLLMPNIITPNNDGINDFYDVQYESEGNVEGAEKFYSYTIRFYNRWGTTIFEGFKNANDAFLWDGTYKDNDVSEGVYFYILEFKATCTEQGEQIVNRQGHVTVVR